MKTLTDHQLKLAKYQIHRIKTNNPPLSIFDLTKNDLLRIGKYLDLKGLSKYSGFELAKIIRHNI